MPNKERIYKAFTKDQVLEAKEHYTKEAHNKTRSDLRAHALQIVAYFDEYPDRLDQYDNARHYKNRIEGMIERYFKCKEKERNSYD